MKIRFELESDEEGWPPVACESMWAAPVSGNRFTIDNIPFFVTSIALGDVVSTKSVEGHLAFDDLVSVSGNSTIRLVLFEKLARERILNFLQRESVEWEGLPAYNLVALNIPKDANLGRIRKYLQELEDADVLSFEEACVAD